jgi:hypothetical protein
MTGLEQGLFPRGDKESDDLEEEPNPLKKGTMPV